jgi:hypothetical protein
MLGFASSEKKEVNAGDSPAAVEANNPEPHEMKPSRSLISRKIEMLIRYSAVQRRFC